MKLTTEQIAQIEETLVLNGLVYQDVKLEIIDHIASEIEERMSQEEISFDRVCKSVFEKWKSALVISSSYAWLGAFFKAPQFVVDKLVAYSKREALHVFFSVLVFGSLLAFIVSNTFQKETFKAISLALQGVYTLLMVCTSISMFLIWRSTIKTMYGRLFLFRGWLVFLFCFQFNIYNDPLKHFDANNSFLRTVVSCLLLCTPFVYSFFQLMLASEHFKIEKKLKLV
ncbi:MAG: hypothetical protein ACK4M4_00445 [Flavobacterium sp.]|uniref:hypothetical protein n=1 Tax=Flavobacterium sp. CECT 9288 TaxID=2845819 RepID=UPI001E481E6B|nr:hypothetical protein [Flavobacterium sp. CECT 9288]CAH0337408.1 hypothetical protein FVB9288_03168 [Flavobacterium sp. CECT 9288]